MKELKKILGVFVLLFLMMINFDIVQAAAPPRLDEENLGTLDTDQATITISKIDAGDRLAAYKILDVYKNAVTNEINYRYTDQFYAFLEAGGAKGTTDYKHLTEEEYFKLTSGDITSGSTQTSSTLDQLVSEYAYYITKNNISGISMSNSGTTASLTTDTGSYLILPTSTNRLYAVMVANLDYEVQDGVWVKQNDSIVAKVSDPSIKASIKEMNQKQASFIIGEEYTYFVESTVPPYPTNSKNSAFYINIVLGRGITFSGLESMTIKDGSRNLTILMENGTVGDSSYVAKVVDDDNQFVGRIEKHSDFDLVITFDRNFIVSNNLLISYNAKLNNQATVCRNKIPSYEMTPNDMFVALAYSYAYVDYTLIVDDSDQIFLYDSVHAYTFKLQINKYELGNTSKKLGGAVFEIYSDSALTKKVGTVTTDDNGFIEFSGLGEGKYYLKEVTAPTGYSLLKHPTEIEIKYDESLTDSETGEYCGPVVDISNTKISALPITGGMGTIIFTIIGILLIGSAGIGITYYKRKNKISA